MIDARALREQLASRREYQDNSEEDAKRILAAAVEHMLRQRCLEYILPNIISDRCEKALKEECSRWGYSWHRDHMEWGAISGRITA